MSCCFDLVKTGSVSIAADAALSFKICTPSSSEILAMYVKKPEDFYYLYYKLLVLVCGTRPIYQKYTLNNNVPLLTLINS